jgi:hypothetical protein
MKVWLLILAVYGGPYNSVDWDGPWDFAKFQAMDRKFKSEAECRNTAIMMIADMHKGMLAPMRFACVPFAAFLPKGASR